MNKIDIDKVVKLNKQLIQVNLIKKQLDNRDGFTIGIMHEDFSGFRGDNIRGELHKMKQECRVLFEGKIDSFIEFINTELEKI